MVKEYKHLSPEDVDFFLEHGYLVVKHAFSREKAAEFTKDMWTRLGLDPHDQSTWPVDRDRIHMPYHRQEPIATFAPRVWEIMKELLGGEDRIDAAASAWGDSFIVNLGRPAPLDPSPSPSPSPSPPPPPVKPAELDNWHVDGDFFVHFLDSPEQALLVIPVFSDIAPGGGATYIAPQALAPVARYLAAHPEGVLPVKGAFVPTSSASSASSSASSASASTTTSASASASASDRTDDARPPGYFSLPETVRAHCTSFVELTAATGDVVLLHPLMPHSASPNRLAAPRVITNPRAALRAPFRFARPDAHGYSLVERKTLRALGVDRLEFAPTAPRRGIVPPRVAIQAAMLEEEKRRLEEARANRATRVSVDAELEAGRVRVQVQTQTQTQTETRAIAVN